jgi:hypothetical protein
MMEQLNQIAAPDLDDWIFVKERGAIVRSGNVYRSSDGTLYLRTGEVIAIRSEAAFGKIAWQNGFPVPEVTEIGQFADGLGYFVEKSAGDESFGDLLGREYTTTGSISNETFGVFLSVSLQFLAAQINPSCRQSGPSELRAGIQLGNVVSENPDVADLLEQAVAKAEQRLQKLPLVLTHGDLSPFNIMPSGIIDFEERFVAPAGLDAVTSIAFHQLWDHPKPDGTGTMRLWDFSRRQVAEFLSEADALFAAQGLPLLSPLFDDFLMLKAIWALCYERPDDLNSTWALRWHWRRRVAVYCAECSLASKPIRSETFRAVGLGQTDFGTMTYD